MVQGIEFHAPNAGGTGLIPSWGTKIMLALWHGKKKKKKESPLQTMDKELVNSESL